MKSNKQRRAEILAQRKARAAKAAAARAADPRGTGVVAATAPCNTALLAPYNSYGVPAFVVRGFYLDTPFACASCHAERVWRATQQKWWYEVAKGHVESRAKLCRACRRLERARRAKARLLTFDGAIRRHAAVERWLAGHSGELGAIARRWFEVIRGRGGDVRELLHDGCPTACVDDAGFAYVDAFTAHVNVGFFRGAQLADPKGLLEGTGRFMRHVKLRPAEAVDEHALTELIRAAYADIKQQLDAE